MCAGLCDRCRGRGGALLRAVSPRPGNLFEPSACDVYCAEAKIFFGDSGFPGTKARGLRLYLMGIASGLMVSK